LRLTVYTDYALRMLMYLAVKEDDLATIAEIADSYNISRNHLMKVVHQLGIAGYVETVRGRGGGLRLGRPASEISLGEVVRATETDMVLVPCFDPTNLECPLRRACVLRSALAHARDAFIAVLDEYTLADLAAGPGAMRRMLGIGAAPAALHGKTADI
jgi:Rrf2 family nitric oxide-sensitive transcriptional repressor